MCLAGADGGITCVHGHGFTLPYQCCVHVHVYVGVHCTYLYICTCVYTIVRTVHLLILSPQISCVPDLPTLPNLTRIVLANNLLTQFPAAINGSSLPHLQMLNLRRYLCACACMRVYVCMCAHVCVCEYIILLLYGTCTSDMK